MPTSLAQHDDIRGRMRFYIGDKFGGGHSSKVLVTTKGYLRHIFDQLKWKMTVVDGVVIVRARAE